MCAKYHDVVEARKAAEDATDPSILAELAYYPFVFVKRAVALNRHSDQSILKSLIPPRITTNEDFDVVAAVVAHPATGAELCTIAMDAIRPALGNIEPRDYFARQCVQEVFAHPLLPPASLGPVLAGLKDFLRGLIATTSRNRGILHHLCHDRSPKISAKAAQRLSELFPNSSTGSP